MARPESFAAPLYSVWMLRYVDVPDALTGRFRGKHPAVRATCNGVEFRGTLVPRGGGHYRLAVNAAVRRAAGGVDSGDHVVMTVAPARPHVVPELPSELENALAAVPGGRLAWESWPPGRRRQIIAWLLQAKGPMTRERRVVRILERLGLRVGS